MDLDFQSSLFSGEYLAFQASRMYYILSEDTLLKFLQNLFYICLYLHLFFMEICGIYEN